MVAVAVVVAVAVDVEVVRIYTIRFPKTKRAVL
jgi:hypothetical protein